jgi:creatine kinase
MMAEEGLLFSEPDALSLAGGVGRHWPDARGVFVNEAKNIVVLCNEIEHAHFILMENGADVSAVFARFVKAAQQCEEVVAKEGYGYMHDEKHGYILAQPAECGTGLKISITLKVPFLSSHASFDAICAENGVEATSQSGLWEFSNTARMFKSEVELANTVIEACAKFVKMEQTLESGGSI